MKKLTLLCLLIAAAFTFATNALAAPKNPFPQTVTQADGTEITITEHGDEFFSWAEDENGNVIAYDEGSENWAYAEITKDEIVPSDETVGKEKWWKIFGKRKTQRKDLEPLFEKVDRSANMSWVEPEMKSDEQYDNDESDTGLDSDDFELEWESTIRPAAHTKNRQPLLVMQLEYNDVQFSTTMEEWSNTFFGTTGKTVNTYYAENSGDFNLQFTKPNFTQADGFTIENPTANVSHLTIQNGIVRVRLPKNIPTDMSGDPLDPFSAPYHDFSQDIRRAFDAAKQYVDFSSVSVTPSNRVFSEELNVYAVLAGNTSPGYASKSNTTHEGKEKTISIEYFDSLRTLRSFGTSQEAHPLGVITHELAHVLGAGDLYDYNSLSDGTGGYSLMSAGSWGKISGEIDGTTPVHLDAWTKTHLGFCDTTTVFPGQSYTENLNSIENGYNNLRVVNNFAAQTQYFLAENRQQTGFDRGLSAWSSNSGILIYHVDESLYNSGNNNYNHKFVAIERINRWQSGVNPFYDTSASDRTHFGADTVPNSNFHTSGHGGLAPAPGTDCHPQTRVSGIQITVNSESGHTMQVGAEVAPPPDGVKDWNDHPGILQIAAGGSHSLAIKTDGSLWAWGNNANGQLGDGTTISKFEPVQIGTESNWSMVSAGGDYSMAIKTDGTLWAWGNRARGQLGDGSTTGRMTEPHQIGTDTDWVSISVGSSHTMAIKADSSLWAWGDNDQGRLGDSTSAHRSTPTQIGDDTNWGMVSAGSQHTTALKTDGTLWAWGFNSYGQLGGATTGTSSYIPLQIGTDTDWTAISSTAGSHSLALKANGTLWAWGRNSQGQLGDGSTVDKHEPTQITTETDWRSITAGSIHSAAIKLDGTLWAWGYNSYGTLGDGTSTNRNNPTPIGTDTTWVSLAADSHTMAIKADGSLWTWGRNGNGRLGDGTSVDKLEPIQIWPTSTTPIITSPTPSPGTPSPSPDTTTPTPTPSPGTSTPTPTPSPATTDDCCIDYGNPSADIIVSANDGAEQSINLSKETLDLDGFVPAEFDIGNGKGYKAVKADTFGDKKFPKLLSKGLTLKLKDAGGTEVTFPAINPRPKPKFSVNY